ncbi:HNH endonuclease signature motif containing protein [Corynebacterium marinum]|uniref:HNH nuclease domain-containing protein n=1 Tax=Corynebacterium marinum DSM 44953 TaxID=1224162 RepID=A0A0B6TUI9_9CORY|nr:HNH endonuclease signature motif containing protein [Corynebacterium marinum]AJK69255.1 hypothetical protein B840_08285 [Corynebacterium marinum DSM 44953]GGO16902.1 hypothetical protein GCM10010980_13640 [Corynebacterium marinum]
MTAVPASWAIHNPADPVAAARLRAVAADLDFWRSCLPVTYDHDTPQDWTSLAARLSRSTGMSKRHLTANLDAMQTLDRLPSLKAMLEARPLLDMYRLAVIDKAAAGANSDLYHDPRYWRLLDEELVCRFTPSRPQQLLPSAADIRRVILGVIRMLQIPEDPEESSDAADPDSGPEEYFLDTLANGDLRFELTLDQATGSLIHDAVTQAARSNDTSRARAMADLLLGNTSTTVTLNLYRARDVDGAPVYHPAAGMLTPEAAGVLSGLATTTQDIDPARDTEVAGYRPTTYMRAYLIGRDWICRWPDCNNSARWSQPDHRVNWPEGPTSPCNLVSLCPHHHNRKTDVQAVYLLDHITGDVYWHFSDGTYAVDRATGPLAPAEKHWVQTFSQRRARRQESAAARQAEAAPPEPKPKQESTPTAFHWPPK